MKKHLTFDDRVEIQQGLKQGDSFLQIADRIGKSRSTVSREVRARRTFVPSKGSACIHRSTCRFPQACSRSSCTFPSGCRSCGLCREGCGRFEEEICRKKERPPYVCSGCQTRRCGLHKWTYDAKAAQAGYERTLRESREGISLSGAELEHADALLSEALKRGLSVQSACALYAGELTVSPRTVYAYIDGGLLQAGSLDLRRKVQRPWRKKSGPVLRVDKKCHQGRTYEDYLAYMQANPDTPVCQMDTVEGKKGGKVLLTVYLTNCSLQLMYLRDRNTADSVSKIFGMLRQTLGPDQFQALLPVILADRGPEFTDPLRIEEDPASGRKLCRLFYCDPQNSNQKSECERNHELIRYVIPKGTSMDSLAREDVRLMMNHVNSYGRQKLGGRSPLELFCSLYGIETAAKLGLQEIPLSEILLRPSLLKK